MTDEKKSNVIDIKLTNIDIQDLLEVLQFASKAAVILAQTEMQKGAGITAAARMNRLARNAQEFSIVVAQHMDIGEPVDGQVH